MNMTLRPPRIDMWERTLKREEGGNVIHFGTFGICSRIAFSSARWVVFSEAFRYRILKEILEPLCWRVMKL